MVTSKGKSNSLDRNVSIPDFFCRPSRSQQSDTGFAQALGELEEIRLVVHRQQGFDSDYKRVFGMLSEPDLPIGVDIVFSSLGSKDQKSSGMD